MIKYFTPNVSCSTDVNDNIEIIRHRNKFCRLTISEKNTFQELYHLVYVKAYVKTEISPRNIYAESPIYYRRTAIPSQNFMHAYQRLL